MTEARSSESFGGGFKTYLRYKIKSMSKLLLFTCGLNLLFLLALSMNYAKFRIGSSGGFLDRFSAFFFAMVLLLCVGLAVCAGAGAFISFGHYLHKDQTDMVYTLPLTYKQRFFGDLISGYVVGTAPFVPGGVGAILIFQAFYREWTGFYMFWWLDTDIFQGDEAAGFLGNSVGAVWGRGTAFVLALFFIYTVTYLVCVVAASCCGKTSSAVVSSVLMFFAEWALIMGFGLSFASSVTGMRTDLPSDFCMYLSIPFGTLAHLMSGILNRSEDNNFLKSWENYRREWEDYYGDLNATPPVFNVFVILFYLALAAGLIFLAYRIGKRRAPENTGKAVVRGKLLETVLWAGIAGAIMSGFAMAKIQFVLSSAVRAVVIGIAAAAAVFIAVGAVLKIKRLKKPFRPEVLLRVGASLAAGSLVCLLFDATGAFGLAYYAPAPSEVRSVEITAPYSEPYNRVLVFSDEDDIQRFQELEREFLKENKNSVRSASSSSYIHSIVLYTLKNGKRFERYYSVTPEIHIYDPDKEFELGSEFAMCYRSLSGYPALVADRLTSDTARGCVVELGEDTLNVSADKTNEFVELYAKDMAENYSVDDNVVGTAVFYLDNLSDKGYSLPITDKMTSVTSFLNNSENLSEENAANPRLYIVSMRIPYKDLGDLVNTGSLSVVIRQDDLDIQCVQEFFDIYENYSVDKQDVQDAVNISVYDIKTGEESEIYQDKVPAAASLVSEMAQNLSP